MARLGEVVWAKLRGYPWWPAQIVSVEAMPKVAKGGEKDLIPVYFFGSRDYALIHSECVKEFDEENWASFKGKCSAPKFRSALTEARKVVKSSSSEPVGAPEAPKRKRGRPKKIDLTETRRLLQQLFYTNNVRHTETILEMLEKVSSSTGLSKANCKQSKLGPLLKQVFCSKEDFGVWQRDEELLRLVGSVAKQLINMKMN